MLPIDVLQDTYDININCFDYHNHSQKITSFLGWQDWPVENEPHPRNCGINFLLHIDKRGSSKLYRKMEGSNGHILDNICGSWQEDSSPELCNFTLSTSFSLHHSEYQDTYPKYIQFRALHKRLYTNDKLFKIWIKESNICSICGENEDSANHMSLDCPITSQLWSSIEERITKLGFLNITLTNKMIILGFHEKPLGTNSIILLRKMVTYNAKTHAAEVKGEMINLYYQEKYRYCMKGRKIKFENKYSFLINVFEK